MTTNSSGDAAAPDKTNNNETSKCFVLVHGAWHGAWVWQAVAAILRKQGHKVYTPVLSGLGERASILSADITLDTFVDDIEDAILHPQSAASLDSQRQQSADDFPTQNMGPLTNVILVGHSFAGPVISAVAERIPEQLDRLIYLDAFLLQPGQSTFDTLDEKVRQSLRNAAEKHGGYGLPAPDPKHLGIPPDHASYRYVQERLTPHPLNTYTTAVSSDNSGDEGKSRSAGVKRIYLACTEPAYKPVAAAYAWVKTQNNWTIDTVPSSHLAPVVVPETLADKLQELAVI